MSRKPVRSVKQSQSTTSVLDSQESLALLHLDKGRFRDAIVCYKTLIKIERRAEWIAGLATAYAGRAKGLAVKGLFEEAIELWRSRAELCGTPLWDGPYVGWLISEGRLVEVLGYLAARRAACATAPKLDDEIVTLEAQLAPALLAADEATVARLPTQSPLVLHRPLALIALSAYANKDAVALESALADIPFRSPYKDLRLLLKAIVQWETDRDSARQAFDRLPQGGPFEPLAAPFRTLQVTGAERLRHWAGLNAFQQAVALDLTGLPHTMAPLLRALAATDVNFAPAALFDLVQQHARVLPESIATRVWQWLAPWATRRDCACPRIFGNPTLAMQECATALAVEIKAELTHSEQHWTKAVKLMSKSKEADDPLRTALVLRHMAYNIHHLSREGILDEEGEEMLTESLKYDTHDCDVYIRLVRFWRLRDDLKRSREHLDLGLIHFPDDVTLLTEAVETALAAAAFKKAAIVARHLLELDPLNRKVRSMVGNAHLSHAAKLIAVDNLEAAKKEITEAATWLGEVADQGRLYLLQAWAEPAGCNKRLRLAQLAADTWGGGLAAGWRLMREAQGTFANIALPSSLKLLKEAGIDTPKVLTATDIRDLAQVLEQEKPIIRKELDPLAPWRREMGTLASKPVLNAEATVRICEALSRHHEYDLVEKFANVARKFWPDRPIFVYHAAAARFGKQGSIDSERDYDDLENAQLQARRIKDPRLVMRIEALFEADDPDPDPDPDFSDSELPVGRGRSGSSGKPSDLAKFNKDEMRNVIEMMIKMDGVKSFMKAARMTLGDDQFRQIEKESSGDRKVFLDRVIDMMLSKMDDIFGKPKVPAEKKKPKTPIEGQRKLNNE